jgi:arylsulfatase
VTPFHGEKGTTWEGGMRVPQVVRWPGVIEPGTVVNDIMSHEDWMPTLVAAAGDPDIVEKLGQGTTANGKEWRVHLDGYNFLPFFMGEEEESPRQEIIYFGQGGELNAVRYNDWKINFAGVYGNIATGERRTTNWPMIVNLRADPYETMPFEGEMGYLRWYADNMWLFVPVQQVVKEFLSTVSEYPFQAGSSLNASNINYNTLRAADAMERLGQIETLMPPARQ